jgi:hypothetical protein
VEANDAPNGRQNSYFFYRAINARSILGFERAAGPEGVRTMALIRFEIVSNNDHCDIGS